MIYGTKCDSNYNRLPPQLDAVLARVKQVKPKAFLFSGGGNDVAGDEFAQYFNHASSGLEAFRKSFAEFHIGVVFKKYLDDLCFKVRQANPSTIILMHGYGYTPPTGKAVINGGPFRFVGPWLRPVLTAKNIIDPQEQRKIVFSVIDLYNKTLEEVQNDNPDNFCYVDLRSVINPDADWVNELHLSNSAFYWAAACIHEKLQSLA
jgi:hypothetical protein